MPHARASWASIQKTSPSTEPNTAFTKLVLWNYLHLIDELFRTNGEYMVFFIDLIWSMVQNKTNAGNVVPKSPISMFSFEFWRITTLVEIVSIGNGQKNNK